MNKVPDCKRSLEFNGTEDDFIIIETTPFNNLNCDGSSNFTISVFVQPTPTCHDMTILHKTYKGTKGIIGRAGISLIITTTKYVQFSIHSYSYGHNTLESVHQINPMQWNNITIMKNGTDMYMYINGVKSAWNKLIYGGKPTKSPWLMGQTKEGDDAIPTNFYRGRIGGLYIWNIAFSEEEAKTLYLREIDRYERGLIACYRFDNARGKTLYEYTKKNHGMIFGCTWCNDELQNGLKRALEELTEFAEVKFKYRRLLRLDSYKDKLHWRRADEMTLSEEQRKEPLKVAKELFDLKDRNPLKKESNP